MSRTTKLVVAAVAVSSSAALLFSGAAAADPAPPLPIPIDGLQAPGLPAMQSLSPAILQAAADPTNAASMLMAAAAAFAGNSAAPADAKDLASVVNRFVSDPAAAPTLPSSVPGTGIPLPSGVSVPGPAPVPMASTEHIPPAGVIPGTEAHLLPGVDPAHALGPVVDPPEAAPAPAPAAAPAPAPDAVPAPVPTAAPAPAPAPDAEPLAAPVAPEAASAPVAPDAAPAPPAPAPAAAAFGPDAPPTQDFLYPSIGNGCLADGGNALATAISVAGPAKIPTPGPAAGQTAYVFTAVGTAGPAAEQRLPLNVTWVNLTTGKSGSATLTPRSDINPAGPTTLTAIVDTGSGSIMSTIFGQITTTEKQCQFMPTIGSTVVP
jgi:hypothetical protein